MVCMNTQKEVEIGVKVDTNQLLQKNYSMRYKIILISLQDIGLETKTLSLLELCNAECVDLELLHKRNLRRLYDKSIQEIMYIINVQNITIIIVKILWLEKMIWLSNLWIW